MTQENTSISLYSDEVLSKLPQEIQERIMNLQTLMSGKKVGFEEGAQNGFKPALVKIVQPVTTDSAKPDTAKPGDLFHKGGMIARPLRGVVAYSYVTRVRFAPGDNRPSCSSENVDLSGRGKDDKSTSVYGVSCSECPYNDQPFTGGKKTNCNNIWNVIFVPENLENIFHLTFSKSSYGTGRQLIDLARATQFPWSRFYDVNTEVKKRDKAQGVYAIPAVSPVSDPSVPVYLQAAAQHVCDWMSEARKIQKNIIVQRTEDITVFDTLTADAAAIPDYSDKF